MHTGAVVAGIIGENKFAYDMWGDAVNTASRMESHGEAGKIHVSEEFKHAVETLHATSLHAETLHATSLQFATHNTTHIADGGIKYAVETLHATSLQFATHNTTHIADGGIEYAVETLHATSLHAETLHATSLQFIRRGEIDIKGKGLMKTYFLEKA